MNGDDGARDAPLQLVRAHLVTTRRCNYRCQYCVTPPRAKDLKLEGIDATLQEMRQRYGSWSFHLTGGEPTIYSGILELLSMIKHNDHRCSMVTNLTGSRERLRNLLRTAGPALKRLSASYHPTMVDLTGFLSNLDVARLELPDGAELGVTVVLTRENTTVLPQLEEALNRRGIELRGLAERVLGLSRNAPTRKRSIPLVQTSVHTGRLCRAGIDYLWIGVDRQVHRCVNDRVERAEPLGYFSPSFRLMHEAARCTSAKECCVRPHETGMLVDE